MWELYELFHEVICGTSLIYDALFQSEPISDTIFQASESVSASNTSILANQED